MTQPKIATAKLVANMAASCASLFTEGHPSHCQHVRGAFIAFQPTRSNVAWHGASITVRCAGKTFPAHQTGAGDNKFVSEDEDPVAVTLTDDERYHVYDRIQ